MSVPANERDATRKLIVTSGTRKADSGRSIGFDARFLSREFDRRITGGPAPYFSITGASA
jgi:hypothetical protein